MGTLNLLDLIEKSGLLADDVVIIRHALTNEYMELCWRKGFFEEYQKIQPERFFKDKKYVLSFVSGPSTSARFVGCYEVGKSYPIKDAVKNKDYPCQWMYSENTYYFELEPAPFMEDLKNRLVIDWGKSYRTYVQHTKEALRQKDVLAIDQDENHAFPGYDKVCWSFEKMKKIVDDPKEYAECYEALRSVNGVYLVLDTVSGLQYVGSAYGEDGIYGRWKTYSETNGQGGKDEDGNQGMVEHLQKNPGRYKDFQYSILQIVHKTGNKHTDKVNTIEVESLFKEKLGTRKWGLNRN